ncbi:hypothetical protein ACWCRF_11540 [Streptomyces sp. NPDC002405]
MSKELEAARGQLEDARRAKKEADALIEALEERVLEGEEDVVVMELGQRYGVQRLAQLEAERAERRVKAAEAEERRQTLEEARREATDELSAVSTEAIDVLHRKALVALEDFVSACQAREEGIDRHAQQLKALGDREVWVDTNSSDVAVRVGGELYRLGEYRPDTLAARAVGAVLCTRVRFWREVRITRPDKHQLDGPLLDGIGADRAARDVNWGSKAVAERLLDHARATVEGGEAA